jgi:hypothetical protein
MEPVSGKPPALIGLCCSSVWRGWCGYCSPMVVEDPFNLAHNTTEPLNLKLFANFLSCARVAGDITICDVAPIIYFHCLLPSLIVWVVNIVVR